MKYTTVDTCQIAALPDLLLTHIGYKADGVFVEVGAFDGKSWSNTHDLAAIGWRGLYVEPQPEYAEKCRVNHQNHPGVFIEQVACGPYPGAARLYLGGSVSTISPDTVDAYRQIPTLSFTGLDRKTYIETSVVTLDTLLLKWGVAPLFDLLVVDVEGTELDVLRGFDLGRWLPKMAIIEVHEDLQEPELNWKHIPIGHYFARHQYQKVYHDIINTIWVHP